ncbi:MAG: DnaJ domain-containing protein [Deltaproteobacteria bacterium]|nr:DnaJ domain-containing protein [Deltaproteobacteria bacterium]
MVHDHPWYLLGPGDFARVVYGLWWRKATGILTVSESAGRPEVLVLLRGDLVVPEADALGRQANKLLETICSWPRARYHFDGGVNAHPPGGSQRRFSLGGWVRRHYEAQLDRRRAEALVHELAGVRLALRPGFAPPLAICDETDRRILDALAKPRRLDQIWPLARCPRFRLLAFVHFLRHCGGLDLSGVAAPAPTVEPELRAARRLLGVDGELDPSTLKRAYRRRVRALHPDLRPGLAAHERRQLESRLAEVNRAYRLLSS